MDMCIYLTRYVNHGYVYIFNQNNTEMYSSQHLSLLMFTLLWKLKWGLLFVHVYVRGQPNIGLEYFPKSNYGHKFYHYQ